MTLTIDNAYNSKIISNNDASIDIVDIESRKLIFDGSVVVVEEGSKLAGAASAAPADSGLRQDPRTEVKI